MNVGWLEVSLPVKDVGRSRAFYEKLGFRLVSTADAGMSATLQGGRCRLALYQGVLDGGEAHLIFWQGDVEACAQALSGMGYPLVRELSSNEKGEASVMFRDPGGQLIFVVREDGVTRNLPAPGGPDLPRGHFQVSLPVKDIGATVAFYEILGFRRVGDHAEERMADLTNGESRICLYQGHLDPDALQLIFWQGDIEAMADVVSSAGLSFLRPPNRDASGAGFMILDPDEHPIFFISMHKYLDTDFAV
jgi:catechol 2,3-dioxygenase-like lactoylglutathione lyase family enzyme